MAAKPHILFDKTELVLVIITNNGAMTRNVTYDQIMSITIDSIKVKKLFKEAITDQIAIKLKVDPENPITYSRLAEKDHFDSYKTELATFAKRNKLSFVDNTVK